MRVTWIPIQNNQNYANCYKGKAHNWCNKMTRRRWNKSLPAENHGLIVLGMVRSQSQASFSDIKDTDGSPCRLPLTCWCDQMIQHESKRVEPSQFPTRQLVGPGITRPQAKLFLEPQQLLSWELCNISMSIGSCVYPMTQEDHWVLGNHAVPNTRFLHLFWLWSWNKHGHLVTSN